MSLDVGDALRDGANRTATVNGGLLMAAFAVLGVLGLILGHSLQLELYEWAARQNPEAVSEVPTRPLAVSIPVPVLVVGLLANLLLGETTRIVAVRTMATDADGLIPGRLVVRNLPLAVVNGVVASLVVGIVVAIGSIFFLLPGIFLALSFFFVRQEIALEDENFVEAMARSWDLSEGSRVDLAVLALVVFTVLIVVLVLSGVMAVAFSQSSVVPWIGRVLFQVPVTVFGVGAATQAYVQLKDGDCDDEAEESIDDESGGDDDAEEWPDPPGFEI